MSRQIGARIEETNKVKRLVSFKDDIALASIRDEPHAVRTHLRFDGKQCLYG
jgi:hypothetical protein